MLTFTIRRLGALVPLLVGVLLLTFLIMQAIPGSVVEQMMEYASEEDRARLRHELGLDLPVHVQFLRYLSGLLRGDLGRTLVTRQEVAQELFSRVPNTLRLGVGAMLVATLLGLTAGIACAVTKDTWIDHSVRFLSLVGLSTPVFWTGLVAMLVVSLHLRWLPASGDGAGAFTLLVLPRVDLARGTVDFTGWQHLVLPALTLGVRPAAFIGRVMRSTLLAELGSDYVRTARAKGLPAHAVVLKHALANALVPVVTLIGMDLGSLLSGAVITERIFSYRGVGSYTLQGIIDREPAIVMATVLLGATVFVLANLAVDLVNAWIDPRVREAEGL